MYCLCVNVYCTTATGCQPNCSWQIYHIISRIKIVAVIVHPCTCEEYIPEITASKVRSSVESTTLWKQSSKWCIVYLSEDHHSFHTNHTRIAEWHVGRTDHHYVFVGRWLWGIIPLWSAIILCHILSCIHSFYNLNYIANTLFVFGRHLCEYEMVKASCMSSQICLTGTLEGKFLFSCAQWIQRQGRVTVLNLPYFPAHKMHHDIFVRNFRKK